MNSYFIFANVAKNIHPAKTYSIIYYFIGFTVRIRYEMFLKVQCSSSTFVCVPASDQREIWVFTEFQGTKLWSLFRNKVGKDTYPCPFFKLCCCII